MNKRVCRNKSISGSAVAAIDRRRFFGLVGKGMALPVAVSALATPAILLGASDARANAQFFAGSRTDNGVTFRATNFDAIDKRWHRQMVKYFSDEPHGTVVVDTRNHFLYWIWENNTAIRYGIAVGKEGFKWYGRSKVARKARWPRWTPPPEMRERSPNLPEFMDGGPDNPLGPRALYLYDNGVDTGYRLHGTTAPWSIGKDASSGCIRMFNEDAIDLYRRCPLGTACLVLEHIADRSGVPVDPS